MFKFPVHKVNIGIEIMIQINHYMHSVTLEEEQHSPMRNVSGNCLCTCLLRTSEFLFTSNKMKNKLCQLYFIMVIPG